MQNVEHMHDGPNGLSATTRRLATLAAICGLTLAVISLPVGLDSSGLVSKPAFAASDNGNAGGNGNGNGRDGAPGQNKDEMVDSDEMGDADAETEAAITESGETPEDSTLLPIAEDVPANARVIKEIAGLSEESELTEEEELEAIRSGWGTWRTADGPETVIAQ